MKALLCKTLGLPDTLVHEETADPQPGPGQVVVDMKAAGVNFPDALIIRASISSSLPCPLRRAQNWLVWWLHWVTV